MIEIDTTDVYCFVFTDLRSYAGNKYDHFVKYNVINEIQFINFYHNVYILSPSCKKPSGFTTMAASMFYSILFKQRDYFMYSPISRLKMYFIQRFQLIQCHFIFY